MPRVPHFGPVQADTSVLTPARADAGAISPELAATPGRQQQQAGNAMMNLGGAALEIMTRIQRDVNQVQVSDALNKARQKALDLTYDPQAGFLARKGSIALKSPDGVSLTDEYGQRLQETISELTNTLDNDEQRQAFAQRAADLATSFTADVQKHTLGEFAKHSLSVQDGIIKLSTDDAERNWSDPVKIDTALNEVKAAVVHASQLQSDSANETLSKMKIATSRVHTGVISAALQNGSATYANQYLQKYKDDMTADDILKVNGALTKNLGGQVAQEAVRITFDKFASQFQPTENERLQSTVESIESGGKDFGTDGAPLTSPKGAKYRMQVMGDTAKNPGFGVRPAANDSPAEYNRVGREYLTKMVEKYGNVPQALAAYNAGPGAVDEALAKAKRSVELSKNDPAVKPMDWLSFMPAETRDYVRKGTDKFNTGSQVLMPSQLEVEQFAVSLLGSNPHPEHVKLTRDAAAHQYTLVAKSIKQREEAAVVEAMHGMIKNGGRYLDLPEAVRAKVPPKEVDNLLSFGQRISKGEDSTNPWLYNRLTASPETLVRMSENEFVALRRELSEADFKHFSNERAKLMGKGGSTANGHGDLNSAAIKQTLDERLRMLKIDPTPKDGTADAAWLGGLRKFVNDYFLSAQREAGKKFTDAEVSQHIDRLYAKNGTFRGLFSNSSGPMLNMKAGDIPEAEKTAIRDAFRRQGVDNPTDAQMLDVYWKAKVVRK